MQPITSFVSIDFETMFPGRNSVCAVGCVKFVDGVMVQRFYSLVRPTECVGRSNSDIHGITMEMVENAPTFEQLLPCLEGIAGGFQLVAHNASFERDCLEQSLLAAGRAETTLRIYDIIDTMEYCGRRKLVDVCAELGIDSDGMHHDPLCDATMCARVFLASQGTLERKPQQHERRGHFGPKEKKFDHDDLIPLPPDEVEHKDTPFFGVKVVYSGNFRRFRDRTKIAYMLRQLGADVDTSVTKRTAILVVGSDPGPKKVDTAEKYGIRIMPEDEFYGILDAVGFVAPPSLPSTF